MRTTRSGTTYSPFQELLNTSASIDLLLANAYGKCATVPSSPDDLAIQIGVHSDEDIMDSAFTEFEDDQDLVDAMVDVPHAQHHMLTKAEKDKKRRQQRRKSRKQKDFWVTGQPPKVDTLRRIIRSAQVIESSLVQGDVLGLPSSSCGYQAKPDGERRQRKVLTLQETIDKGYEIIPWNGRDTKLITHGPDKRVIAVCVGWDSNSSQENRNALYLDAYNTLRSAREDASDIKLECGAGNNPRGNFESILCGINHGRGSKVPHNVLVKGEARNLVDGLLANKSIIRLANFASASLRMFAPRLYQYYHDRMKDLDENTSFKHLKRPFPGSIFACAGFNIGEKVSTFMHRDSMNCPFGWCSIQALGPFDSKKGGHMVLDDLKVAIEFPSGGLMLLPSATLKHGNTAVGRDEDRVSFTQFTPGNLFRFIDCGFQTERSVGLSNPRAYDEVLEKKNSRWNEGVKLWSTFDELLDISLEEQA